MARVIYKFGGTSVGDTRRLYRAARRIAAAHRAGDEVVAVLSAQAGATDACSRAGGRSTRTAPGGRQTACCPRASRSPSACARWRWRVSASWP